MTITLPSVSVKSRLPSFLLMNRKGTGGTTAPTTGTATENGGKDDLLFSQTHPSKEFSMTSRTSSGHHRRQQQQQQQQQRQYHSSATRRRSLGHDTATSNPRDGSVVSFVQALRRHSEPDNHQNHSSSSSSSSQDESPHGYIVDPRYRPNDSLLFSGESFKTAPTVQDSTRSFDFNGSTGSLLRMQSWRDDGPSLRKLTLQNQQSQYHASTVGKTIPEEDSNKFGLSEHSESSQRESYDWNHGSASSTRLPPLPPPNTLLLEDEDPERKKLTAWWEKILSWRSQVGTIIFDDRVQLAVIVLIAINALMLGIATFDFVSESPSVSSAFEIVDRAFLILFTAEAAMQLFFHGANLLTDGWLMFDIAIVTVSWTMNSLTIARAFRIFRAFRLVTRLTILRNLVSAIIAVTSSMVSILVILGLIIYIYGVLCTSLYRDAYEEFNDEGVKWDYFGSLFKSFFTLFEMLTMEWSPAARSLMPHFDWFFAVIFQFLVISSFTLFSLIIAVICDAVKVIEHKEKEEHKLMAREEVREYVQRLEQRIQEMTNQQEQLLRTLQVVVSRTRLLRNKRSSVNPTRVTGAATGPTADITTSTNTTTMSTSSSALISRNDGSSLPTGTFTEAFGGVSQRIYPPMPTGNDRPLADTLMIRSSKTTTTMTITNKNKNIGTTAREKA